MSVTIDVQTIRRGGYRFIADRFANTVERTGPRYD